MPDEFYIALQVIHGLVFALLLLNKRWRITAGFLLLSAVFYYFAEPYIATMREEMYLIRAGVDVTFGYLIFWRGDKGRLIQPLILVAFTTYHLIAFAAFKMEFYSFLYSYIPATNALNVLQIFVVWRALRGVATDGMERISYLVGTGLVGDKPSARDSLGVGSISKQKR